MGAHCIGLPPGSPSSCNALSFDPALSGVCLLVDSRRYGLKFFNCRLGPLSTVAPMPKIFVN